MSIISIIFLAAAVFLVAAIPYTLWRNLNLGKTWSDIVPLTILLFILFFILVGEGLRPLLQVDIMDLYMRFVLIGSIFLGVIPLLVMTMLNMKHKRQKWQDPHTYKYKWLYQIRHILLLILIAMLLLGFVQLSILLKQLF